MAHNRYQQQHAFAPLPAGNFYGEHHNNRKSEMAYRPSAQSGQTQRASHYALPPLDIPRDSVVPSRHSDASYGDLYMRHSPANDAHTFSPPLGSPPHTFARGYSSDGYSSSPINYRTPVTSKYHHIPPPPSSLSPSLSPIHNEHNECVSIPRAVSPSLAAPNRFNTSLDDDENTSIDPQTSASSDNDAEDAGEDAEDGDSTADGPFGLMELEKLFTAALLVNPFMAPHHKIGLQWEKVLSDLHAEGFCKNRDVKTIRNKVNASIDKIEQRKAFGSRSALGRLVSNDAVAKERLNSRLDQLAALRRDAKNTKEKNKAAATKVANKARSDGSKMRDAMCGAHSNTPLSPRTPNIHSTLSSEGITKGPKRQADDEESSDKENSSDSFTNVRSRKKPRQDDMELRELLHRMEERSAENCAVGKALVEAHKEVGRVGQALIDEISKSRESAEQQAKIRQEETSNTNKQMLTLLAKFLE
ncbi:hypothetical protein M422DRAFT_54605 [Sphaerobolus stellatus SS14]|uniref:Uncharacterized protein n=1 Tax=Sphaerobolus stellatus (strain SS14) TaxID=990650 RepID=A0A0C9UHQ6_SPHS4|nr:hypothetical protein M422DRAFT_54605 [Sphaerobolus stellatus SS14]